jgi:translation initiation factor IF-1
VRAKNALVSLPATADNRLLLILQAGARFSGAGFAHPSSKPMAVDPRKAIEIEGKVMTVLAGTMFRVQLANEHVVLAHISGKMRKRFIRLTTGDRVRLQMSPYDVDKARIVYRLA